MKILLVEDNKKLGDNIKQGLTQEGYAVDIIIDGLIAEERILTNRDEYDLVILDRLLPSKDGVSVCLSWRDKGIVIPILMLTALDAVGDKVAGLNAGADDYLAKPFAFEELLARIHALLRRPKQAVTNVLSCGNININTASRVVTYKGKIVSLTLKEFMVLEYLMKNQNKVVTRDTLYSHAWDFADSSFSNTVDVHIKNLRKKIKDNGKIIQTIRGVGYKLKANFKVDEFLTARLKLTFFYSLTAVIILVGSSLVLYKTLLSNLTESINESILNLDIAHTILDRTQDILQNRFITVDSAIVFFVIIIGFLITQKTLKPIKNNMEKQKRFVADASHELRTPVTIAISGIEVALRNKDLDFTLAKKTLENTLVEMKEFSQLSNTLLDISKYDTDKKIEHADIAIDEVIKSVALKMTTIALEKGVVINIDIKSHAFIKGSKIELDRVFYNILDNAITHTPQKGVISISDSISSNKYVITITDTGSGISKDILDKIFDPFFRGDKSRNTQGAGLGLTITKKIIENHNGTIVIKSEVNKGTNVVISIPVSSH